MKQCNEATVLDLNGYAPGGENKIVNPCFRLTTSTLPLRLTTSTLSLRLTTPPYPLVLLVVSNAPVMVGSSEALQLVKELLDTAGQPPVMDQQVSLA